MIYFRLDSTDHRSEHLENAEGWVKLGVYINISEDDFEICDVKIDNVIYRHSCPEFWEVYNKFKEWQILSNDSI